MRLIITSVLFSLLSISAFSQTQISGIINYYAAATAYDLCTNELSINSTLGFEADMKVIIIQMQGAQINTSNDGSFGNITALGQTGKYEKGEIQSITANGIILKNLLVNSYDYNGKVQIVSVPVYESAYVNDELTAIAWNGTTGGVLAVEVSGQMILDANIDVSGKGFRGGTASVANNNCTWLTNANNYSYDQSDWRGAQKGEGVAVANAGQEHGRGAQANGGGGGNDHNSGGGGGSNISSGGQGGDNNEPSFFGCDGTFPGIGGKALTASSDRIFMGGGGGAGHENNGVGTDGGNGGGIVFIIADEFAGLGYSIKANGENAETAAGDGAGGGGGGGTIVFHAQTASGHHFEVEGGNGGTADNTNADRCLGPGGGGSGGRILASSNIPVAPLGLSGGSAGLSINSSSCGNGFNGATDGNNGVIGILDSLLMGNITFSLPIIISQPEALVVCEGELFSILIETEGVDLTYQWQIDEGSGFENMINITPYSGTNTNELQISGASSIISTNQYRLIISSECFEDVTSPGIPVVVTSGPEAAFTLSEDELTVSFSNSSSGATSYLWNFGDNQTSTFENPEHTYADYGAYSISMIAINSCGSDTVDFEISLLVPIMTAFNYSDVAGCASYEVLFTNTSTGTYDELLWSFPGGTPLTSSEQNPVVIYDTPGTYSVSLTASGAAGSNTFTLDDLVEILVPATPSFSWEATEPLIVSFTNTSLNATSYFWTFGDGESSNEVNPVHEYAAFGDYEVTLNAENQYCSVSKSQDVFLVTSVGAPETIQFSISPNPVESLLHLDWDFKDKLEIELISIEGKVVYKNNYQDTKTIDVSRFPSGLYFLKFGNQKGQGQVKFIKL
jgi:PKD repeat protein